MPAAQRHESVRVAGPTDAPDVIAMTDEDGRFCFRARITRSVKAHLVWTPSATQTLVDAIEREITFDLTKRGLALRFDPRPRILQLDTPRASVDAVAILDDDANPRVASSLQLRLANEKEEIARQRPTLRGARASSCRGTSSTGRAW